MSNLLNRRIFLELAGSAAASAAMPGIAELAPKPPLGWNSFDSYGVYLTEEAAVANVRAMAKKLKPSGYEYFVIDNGWFGEYKLIPGTRYPAEKHASDVNLNEYGLLQPSKTYFPHGLRPIIELAHGAGLKFGVHLMRGIPRKAVQLNLPVKGTKYRARDIANTQSICKWCPYNYGVDMDKPGAQQFYNSLINQLAGWGIDFIKADDIVPFPKEIAGVANAIEQCGRPMVFSLSPGGAVDMQHLSYYRRANMLRTTGDVWDRREDLDKGFAAWKKFQGTARPGFWPDLDMIPFGQLLLMSPKREGTKEADVKLAGYGNTRWCQLTEDQKQTFITMRALAASPLFMGGDLATLDESSLNLITNRDMLACDQNGVMGKNIYERDGVEVWVTPQKGKPESGWLGIFNRNQSAKQVAFSKAELGVKQDQLRDIWNKREYKLSAGKQVFEIPADGVAFLRF
jgi:alpha-galactosidase